MSPSDTSLFGQALTEWRERLLTHPHRDRVVDELLLIAALAAFPRHEGTDSEEAARRSQRLLFDTVDRLFAAPSKEEHW